MRILAAVWSSWDVASYIMMGMKIDGRRRFSKTFVNGSKTEYETKKMDKHALYIGLDMLSKLFWRPSILAFPILVRSRKARR